MPGMTKHNLGGMFCSQMSAVLRNGDAELAALVSFGLNDRRAQQRRLLPIDLRGGSFWPDRRNTSPLA